MQGLGRTPAPGLLLLQRACERRGPAVFRGGNSSGRAESQAPDPLGGVPARLQVTGVYKTREAASEPSLGWPGPSTG